MTQWWDCETPETTPDQVVWGADEYTAFQVFHTDVGWFFWDHDCGQCYGPLPSESVAVQQRDQFRQFVIGGKK